MSYQLRVSILYTGMQINKQTAFSRAFAVFVVVFLPVDLSLANPHPERSPRFPLLGFLRRHLSRLLNARRALTSWWRAIGKWSSNGDQTVSIAPVWRCLLVCVQKKCRHFDRRSSCTWKQESFFFPCNWCLCASTVVWEVVVWFLLQSHLLIC